MAVSPALPAPYDFVAVAAFFGGYLFANPELSQLVAPYAVIFFSALIGSLWCVSRKPEDNDPGHRRRGTVLMLKVVGAALIVTIPVAILSAPKLDIEEHRYLYAPIAFIIGAVGDEWKPFLNYCLNFVLRWKSGTPGEEK